MQFKVQFLDAHLTKHPSSYLEVYDIYVRLLH